jgi:hypothetical protein
MKRTQEEIDAEIAALKDLKPRIRPTSMFGDDHIAAIEAQIEVLERNRSADEIDEAFEDEMNVHDAAFQAYDWKRGENDAEAPSADWQSLIVK